MSRWGMTIDLNRCVGCGTCIDACAQRNSIPPGANWRKLANYTKTEHANDKVYLTLGCMHCEEPPCLEVCPTTATYKKEDGIVDIDYKKCIGCGYCVLACPYLAREIVNEDVFDEKYEKSRKQSNSGDLIGICTKCNFCNEKVTQGVAKGLVPGKDREATPECVNSCIADALQFGDLEDEQSMVSIKIKKNKTGQVLPELGLKPAVYFLLKK